MTLAVLCLAAIALMAPITSLLVGLLLPALDRLSHGLPPRASARLWLGLALVPALLSAVIVGAALMPSLGFGPDHCLAHGNHHLHLCPHHLTGAPTLALWLLAAVVPARIVHLLWRGLQSVWLGARTARCLREGAEHDGEAWVFASAAPEAFVLGCHAPEVFVSQGLVGIGRDVYRAAIAHERDHVDHLDAAFRLWLPFIAAGHVPMVASLLQRRHALSQELAADAAAARSDAGPLGVADALLRVAQVAARTPRPRLGFVHGDVSQRVHALLQPAPSNTHRLLLVTLGCTMMLLIGVATSHHEIHHGLESLLGLLHHP